MERVSATHRDAVVERKSILVVEDEFLVRWRSAEFLREAGYRVFEATSVDEAIAVLSSGTPVHIVFSDINLPGELTGHSLAHWLEAHHPHIPLLLTSGNTVAVGAIKAVATRAFIPKPYRLETVQERLEAMLGGT